jgi:hypothetical protein
MGIIGKYMQNDNHEIELLQQALDDAFQEIDTIHKFNDSIMGKVIKFITSDNKLYQEFVGFSTYCISELVERLESLDQWEIDILELHDKKDQMIKSLKQELLEKENALLALENEVKKLNLEKVTCDAICETSDFL